MKLCIVCPYALPEKGAAVIRVEAFREFFEKKGHSVRVLAPARGMLQKGNRGIFRYGGLVALMKEIISSDFDVVIGTSPPLTHNFFALLACRLSRKKFVLDAKEDPFTFESLPPALSLKGIKRRIYFFLRSLSYRHSDRLFFLTELDRKEAVEEFNLKEPKTAVIMNGSDTKKIFFDSSERGKIRKRLGLKKGIPLLIYAGGIGDEDLPNMLESLGKILTEKEAFLFLALVVEESAVGRKHLESLKALIREMGLAGRVFIETNIEFSEMYRYFSAADIGLVPWKKKYYTSIPVKLFDYLASGLLVSIRGPENGSMRDFHKKHAFIGAHSSEWKDFAEKTLELIEGLGSLAKQAGKRRSLIEKNYSREKFAEKALDGLEGLMG